MIKNVITAFLGLSVLILSGTIAMRPAQAQSPLVPFVIIGPVGAPSSCAWPSGASVTSGMALCATTSGLYYSLNGSTTFNPVAPASSGTFPQTITPVSGQCLNGYNSTTGAFSTSACLTSITKAQVLATGVAATTTSTTTLQ